MRPRGALRHRQGRRRQDDRRGRPRARRRAAGRATILCEVAGQTVVAACARRAPGAGEVGCRRAVGDDRRPAAALEEWLAGRSAGPARRPARSSRSRTSSPPRRARASWSRSPRPGSSGGASAGPRGAALRPRRRRRPGDGHGVGCSDAADLRRDRPRRADRGAGRAVSELLEDPARTGYVAVALPEEMPVNETLDLEGRLVTRSGAISTPRRQRACVRGASRAPRSTRATRLPRATATRPWRRRRAGGAVRGRRVEPQRATFGACAATRGPRSLTLPFVFESELELAHYEQLAGRARGTDDAPCSAGSPPSPAGSGALQQLGVLGRADWSRAWSCADRPSTRAARGPGSRSCSGVVGDAGRPASCAGARWRWDVRRRGHRHPARHAHDQPHARAVDARAARRHPPRRSSSRPSGSRRSSCHTAAGSHTIPLLPRGRGRRAARRGSPASRAPRTTRMSPLSRADAAPTRAAASVGVVIYSRRRAAQRRVPAARDRRRHRCSAARLDDARAAAGG